MWRAGLRISEVLALTESDLDADRGAILVRHGKGSERREVAPTINGFTIFGRKGLAKQLNAVGAVTAERAAILAAGTGRAVPDRVPPRSLDGHVKQPALGSREKQRSLRAPPATRNGEAAIQA